MLTEGLAIIISAVITVGGMIFVQISNNNQRKKDSSERFFYEVYPKRLAIYEEAIKELKAIVERGESLMKPGFIKKTAMDSISKDIHTLTNLFARIRMFGSPQIQLVFQRLIFTAREEHRNIQEMGDQSGYIFGRWIHAVLVSLEDFITAVRKDTGGGLVDRTIQLYLPGTKASLFQRIRNKFFPSKSELEIKEMDLLYEKIQEESLRREKDTPKDNER
jgi:hypothetical protein